MKKLLLLLSGAILALLIGACAPTSTPEPEVASSDPVEAVAEAIPTVAPEAEPEEPTPLPTDTAQPVPTDTPVVEEEAIAVEEEVAEEEPEAEIVEETADDSTAADPGPLYRRTPEGAFVIGYESAPIQIIDYSDFL
ncbi:MAG: hypothetical protein AAF633_20885 [Chloroflexota bacterium]